MKDTDYYELLGINKTAKSSEIKAAYKSLALKHHPDRGGDTLMMSRINKAYNTLANPLFRFEYDQTLKANFKPSQTIWQAPKSNKQTVRHTHSYVKYKRKEPNRPKRKKSRVFSMFILIVGLVIGFSIIWLFQHKGSTSNNSTGSTSLSGANPNISSNSSPQSNDSQTTASNTNSTAANNFVSNDNSTNPTTQSSQPAISEECQNYSQTMSTLESEINEVETKIANLNRSIKNERFNNLSQNNYATQYALLEQQLSQYQSELNSTQSNLINC